MDTFYIREKNLCSQKIRETQSYINRAETTIKNLKSKSAITDFDKTQIEKTLTQLHNLQNTLTELNQRQEDLKNHKLDEEYYNQLKEVQLQMEAKKASKVVVKKEPIVKPKPVYKPYNSYGPSEKYMDKELLRFMSSYDYLPDFIKKQLAELPGNKGYIYKDVWFFGEKPVEEGEILIMYEKYRDTLTTYEHKEDQIYIYEKVGKDRRKLVATRQYSKFHDHIIRRRMLF